MSLFENKKQLDENIDFNDLQKYINKLSNDINKKYPSLLYLDQPEKYELADKNPFNYILSTI